MDKSKARQILFDTYWSAAGWKSGEQTPPDDFAYACAAGYMFEPEEFDHDKVLSRIALARRTTELRGVSEAFLSSLSTRRLDIRSALGSYAVLSQFPVHSAPDDPTQLCAICGYSQQKWKRDLNVLNFERHKWGGVRHLDVLYAAFDLELFSNEKCAEASTTDFELMRKIVEIVEQADAKARPRDLVKKLGEILSSNQYERTILLQILGYCGILQPKDRTGYFEEFSNWAYSSNVQNLPARSDWNYPVCWWRGADGLNRKALNYYFPNLYAK
jgi:hypothetical protein